MVERSAASLKRERLAEVAQALDDDPQSVAAIIAAWRSTMAIYADPELARMLNRDGHDCGPVPEPPPV
ncbi:hypothetical protein [Allokutzneria sp. NRRL B-24872]|uniref:hypothetical protein n=1 Tax=Allokutzneria sp. NRRL B-24872 TaxID=1137961 RepID=UPI0011778BEC|nr:hypothetical protein [Allokutzneria sp. NRRL B-24872]